MKKCLMIALTGFIFGFNLYVFKQQNSREVPGIRESQVAPVYSPTPIPERGNPEHQGVASWYDRKVCTNKVYGVSCKTADGEIFDDSKNTLACNSDIPLGSVIRVCRGENCADATCTDRGDFERLGRTFDFTSALFNHFAKPSEGVIKISWEIIK